MMTNVIAYLHTTFAYQSAALQLMVGQANFDAQQLHLKEPLPITVPTNTNDWNVAMPPNGVGGWLATPNYIYRFQAGKLMSIQIKNEARSAAETQPSLIDTNGAYQLAEQWLTAISVDVPALESKYPHSVLSATTSSEAPNRERTRSIGPARSVGPIRNHDGATNNIPHAAPNHVRLPLFRVAWGGVRDHKRSSAQTPVQATMEILGSTKQCLNLHIFDPELLKAPPLQVTNAAALLGPPPPPQHFVEELMGGKAAYDAVARPEKVLVWLVGSQPDEPEVVTNRSAAMLLEAASAAVFSRALTDFNSYSWLGEKACMPDYGVRLQFIKGAETVDFAWCDECDHLQVTHNGRSAEKDCEPARLALVRAIQSIFPRDEIIKNLNPSNPTN